MDRLLDATYFGPTADPDCHNIYVLRKAQAASRAIYHMSSQVIGSPARALHVQ